METTLQQHDITTELVNDTGEPSINSPQIDESSLKPTRRAVTSVDQVYRICDGFFRPDSTRNQINGTIADKLNDSPPFDQKQINDDQEGWRHNFSTGFLSSIINMVTPAPVAVIDSAQFLTAVELDEEDDPSGELAGVFQDELTTLLRNWSGWRTHNYAISQEDCTYGYAVSCCVDPFSWKPRFFRQDEFGVPDGTEQHSNECQFLALRRSLLIHQMLELIEDRAAAEEAGYDIDNIVKVVNSSLPDSARRRSDGTTNPREFVDLIREGNAGWSYEPGARTIDFYQLFSVEASGKVSVTWVSRGTAVHDHLLLFDSFELYEQMSDFCTFYSFEPGNGKLYGSKGLGRKLINLHLATERARNRAADQMYLGSMIWIHSPKGMATVQLKLRHPFGVYATEGELTADALPANIEPFLKLEERLTAWAEVVAGAYIPRKLGEDRPEKTATEATIEAQREMQTRQAHLQRFFGQFADEVSMLTRRACDPETLDEDAKEFQKKLKARGIDAKLLKKLADRPSVEVVHDISQIENQAIAQMCLELRGNPYADQAKITRREVIARTSARFADDVLIPRKIDPVVEAKEINQQILENAAMRSGESVNAVPTDDHRTHVNVITGDMTKAAPKVMSNPNPDPQILDNINAGAAHANAHLGMWEANAKATKNNDDLAEIAQHRQFFDQIEQGLQAKFAQMKQRQAQGPQMMPPPSAESVGQALMAAGAPPQAGGGPAAMGPMQIKMVETIPYDKAAPQIQRQIEAMFGLTPAYGASPQNDWGGPSGGAPAEASATTTTTGGGMPESTRTLNVGTNGQEAAA